MANQQNSFQIFSIILYFLMIYLVIGDIQIQPNKHIEKSVKFQQNLIKTMKINEKLRKEFNENELHLIQILAILNASENVNKEFFIRLRKNLRHLITMIGQRNDVTGFMYVIDEQLLRQRIILMIFMELMNGFVMTSLDKKSIILSQLENYRENFMKRSGKFQGNSDDRSTVVKQLSTLNNAIRQEMQFIRQEFEPKINQTFHHLIMEEEWAGIVEKLSSNVKRSHRLDLNPRIKRVIEKTIKSDKKSKVEKSDFQFSLIF